MDIHESKIKKCNMETKYIIDRMFNIDYLYISGLTFKK